MLKSRPTYVIGVLLLCVVAAAVAAFFNPVFTLSAVALLAILVCLVFNLEFGVLLLIFFFPYLGLVIDFGQFKVFQEVPYLGSVNAPFVDLFGLVFFVAWAINMLRVFNFQFSIFNQIPKPNVSKKNWSFPHARSYSLFWLSGLISLIKVSPLFLKTSIKYFARPFTFFYVVFFAPVVSVLSGNNIHNPSHPPLTLRGGEHRLLQRALMVFYVTGLLSAVNGFLGLFFGAHEGFMRAVPLGFFGVNLLGPNHNLLAETLIATAPAGLILSRTAGQQDSRTARLITYGMFFQWVIALLTFARTAWIAIAIQGVVYYWFTRRHSERSEESRTCLPARQANVSVPRNTAGRSFVATLLRMTMVGVLIAGAVFFITNNFSETVRGSTLSRLDQVRIASFYFWRSPWIGQGVGTFIPTLWQTRAFLLEYGEPLEAHGIIFKLMFEQGLLGLATFGVFVGAIFWRIKKSGNIPALMIAVGSVVYQIFNTTYYTSKLWIPLAIAVAIAQMSKLSFDREKA